MSQPSKKSRTEELVSKLSENYIRVNPLLVHSIGLHLTCILTDLIQRANWRSKDSEWHYYPSREIQAKWGINKNMVSRYFANLKKLRAIETQKVGSPPHTEYRLNHDVILDLMSSVNTNSPELMAAQNRKFESHPSGNPEAHSETTPSHTGVGVRYTDKLPVRKGKKEDILRMSYADFSSPTGFMPTGESAPSQWFNQFVEYWNDLPLVRKHKRSSQSYKKASKYITAIQNGMAFEKFKLDPVWMKRHGISKEDMSRKWTDSQIRVGLERLAKMYNEAFWPIDKSWVPKDLDDLIFNPRSQSSWFLKFLLKPAETTQQVTVQDMAEKLTDHEHDVLLDLAHCIDNCRGERPDDTEMKKLVYVTQDLSAYFNKLPTKAKKHFMHFRDFGLYYCKWVDGRLGGERRLSSGWLGPKGYSSLWREFRVWLEEDVGVNLERVEG